MKKRFEDRDINFNQCTGCGACLVSCKFHAIKMIESKEGFLYPDTDYSKCVNCHKCEKACPLITPVDRITIKSDYLYSGYTKNMDYQQRCSSGGIFGLLADKVISDGGIVYGAAFDAEHKKVVHVSNEEVEINKIFRSKYVQSEDFHCFEEIKKSLISGRKVLFCGCPCQIEGLLGYLGKNYYNLITIDFVCHGVPSPAIFRKYLIDEEKKENAKVLDVTFREKNIQGRGEEYLYLYLSKKNNRKGCKSLDNFYYYLFLYNCILRKSCMNCKRPLKHFSDLTLADDWLQKWEKDQLKSVSLIRWNTQKGMEIFGDIKDELVFQKIKTSNREYIQKPHHYRTKDRKRTFKVYERTGNIESLERVFRFIKFRNETKKKVLHDLSITKKRILGILHK